MVRNSTKYDSFVKPFFRDKECGQFVGCSHKVHQPLGIDGSSDTLVSYAIIVQAFIDGRHLMGMIAGEGSEQIILVEDTLLEMKAILFKICPSVCSENNAYEGEITTHKGIVVIIIHPGLIVPFRQFVRRMIATFAFKKTPAGKAQQVLATYLARQNF